MRLDGSGAGGNTTAFPDTDGGTWDDGTDYDRTVGPMQLRPFGQPLVLDLTEKTEAGSLRVAELAWVTSHRPPGASVDRAVVAGIVTGNRFTPSDFS
ncbi:hypothetical protein AB0H77_27200 [Streptomyces sp. NPDC050844]|uniref:hypothetical protein n=1 Tax=Streptomyces sp. NPDC050844 TaxID=3155790 RepID=UPI0033D7786C